MELHASHQMKASPERKESCTSPRIYDTTEGAQSPPPEIGLPPLHSIFLIAFIFQNIYDTPFEIDVHKDLKDADLKESLSQNKNNDMLKELGLEPVDDNNESPVSSDSNADSWGESIQNENEKKKSLISIKILNMILTKNL